MLKQVCIAIGMMVLVFSSFAKAAERIEVRLLQGPAMSPSTRPALPSAESLAGAKELLSIAALVDHDGNVDATCVVEGRTVHLEGHLVTLTPERRRASISFSDQGPAGIHSTQTSIELPANAPKVIGGMPDGKVIVMTIKSDSPAQQ